MSVRMTGHHTPFCHRRLFVPENYRRLMRPVPATHS